MSGVDPKRLADNYAPQFGLDWVPVLPRDQLERMSAPELIQYHNARKQADEWAAKNPVGSGWVLPSWRKVMDHWQSHRIHVLLGGNRCLRGDTEIYDPVLNVARRIDEITGPHHVLAWNGSEVVVAEAEEPFPKGLGEMLRITLSTGDSFVAAPEHRVLSAEGHWLPCAELRPGCALVHPQSTAGTCLSNQPQGAQRSFGTPSGSQSDYRSSPRLCDEQPRWAEGIDLDASPSPVGAPTRISAFGSNRLGLSLHASRSPFGTSDDRGKTPLCSRASPRSFHQSIRGALRRLAGLFSGIESSASYTPCKSASGSRGDQAPLAGGRQSAAASRRPVQSTSESAQSDNLLYHVSAFVLSVHREETDVKWDMTVPAYGNYLAAGVIHHNSTKSTCAGRICVWALGTIPEAEVRCWHVNGDRSKQDQQRVIYECLPQSLKNLPTKRGTVHSTNWTQANGFTNGILILPPLVGCQRGGRIDFNNYAAYANDAQVAEGFKMHLGWLDEESPVELFKTLMLRTTDFHGRLILSFTTLNGWTSLIQEILGSVKTLEWTHAPLVNKRVPVLQESTKYDGMLIHYFHTEDNPFIDVEEFRSKMKGLSQEDVLARAYGIPSKAAKAAFPLFSRDVHVLDKHEDLPWIKNPAYEVTRYMICDPGGSKNDFLGWVAIDRAGTRWVYREWPDMDTYGEWALPGPTVEGKAGPAQQGLGWGYEREAEEIDKLEEGEPIFERLVDPRMGAQEKKAQDGATNFITDFEKHGKVFIPAPGVDIKSGLKKINGLLQYDPEKPRDSRNTPKIFFSPRCKNWIYMMQEYTATSGTEHTKEGPDLLRYLEESNPEFYAGGDMQATGTEM